MKLPMEQPCRVPTFLHNLKTAATRAATTRSDGYRVATRRVGWWAAAANALRVVANVATAWRAVRLKKDARGA